MNKLEKYIVENDRYNIAVYLEEISIDNFVIDIKKIMAKKQDNSAQDSCPNCGSGDTFLYRECRACNYKNFAG